MLLEALWSFFEEDIFWIRSSQDESSLLFNPYQDLIPEVDLPNADQLRRENLYRYLASMSGWPPCLVVGEAPGWRGCRFSGIPFTSEAQLVSSVLPFSGFRSSQRSSPYTEASATLFWRIMKPYHPQFLVWNCIPFHPHQPGVPLSNRAPSEAEIRKFSPSLARLISLLAPRQVIAIGKSAQKALTMLGISCIAVRHPAHGGSKEFGVKMARILQSLHSD